MTRLGKVLFASLVVVLIGFAGLVRVRPVHDRPRIAAPDGDVAIGPGGLAVPVAGVAPAALVDTFDDPRAGHVHRALDIMARRGTPVLAAMTGTVEKLFESRDGGHTAYLRSADGRWIAYYAHLDGYAADLHEAMAVARGRPIGTVGASGNASLSAPHLHFEVHRMAPGERWYQGTPVNPYPLLAARR